MYPIILKMKNNYTVNVSLNQKMLT